MFCNSFHTCYIPLLRSCWRGCKIPLLGINTHLVGDFGNISVGIVENITKTILDSDGRYGVSWSRRPSTSSKSSSVSERIPSDSKHARRGRHYRATPSSPYRQFLPNRRGHQGRGLQESPPRKRSACWLTISDFSLNADHAGICVLVLMFLAFISFSPLGFVIHPMLFVGASKNRHSFSRRLF